MKHPPLPPVRWSDERRNCQSALNSHEALAADGYVDMAMVAAQQAAAWGVLGWEREIWFDNGWPNNSDAHKSKVRWLNWLETKEQAESRKAERKGTK